MKKFSPSFNRRSFLKTSLIGAAGISLFPLKSCITSDSDVINIGFIGLGRQTHFLQGSFLALDEKVKVIAGADVYAVKRERFLKKANDFYAAKDEKVEVKVFEDYKELLACPDIHAVVIATPDHWHARMAIDALEAGKDIYLEKPLTLSIEEGKKLVKAVRDNNKVLAVGSQQRSDPNFQHAVKLVQDGKLGEIEKVEVFLGKEMPHPKPYDLPEEVIPEGLNWEKWIGPAPKLHYNKVLNPVITVDPVQNETEWGGWRWYKEIAGGLMTDWGAHMMDIAQWALGYDRSGPVKVIPGGYEDNKYLTYIFDNGIHLYHTDFNNGQNGVKFYGTKAVIEVGRDHFITSDESLNREIEETNVAYEGRSAHHMNFIDCIRTRQEPAAPVEVGHAICTACSLGNIAAELNRPIEWDPATQTFVNDEEASAFLSRDYENGYTL
ncbi:MAG: Gfo/Idh/MocA family oxidoreductase [Bacteroidales bacterium]|nr:Gfo/Idh/MocA family oxidoreductase [Bacteroidales bacterium]MCF8392231.1 Gfo/Idh/MocA family oxidoreductase [Bacteroidales bacterium]